MLEHQRHSELLQITFKLLQMNKNNYSSKMPVAEAECHGHVLCPFHQILSLPVSLGGIVVKACAVIPVYNREENTKTPTIPINNHSPLL